MKANSLMVAAFMFLSFSTASAMTNFANAKLVTCDDNFSFWVDGNKAAVDGISLQEIPNASDSQAAFENNKLKLMFDVQIFQGSEGRAIIMDYGKVQTHNKCRISSSRG